MKHLKLELELQEPLIAYTLAGDPNSVVSLPFIPGSMLRGALIARYLRANPRVNLSSDPTARQLFLDGTVQYLNAYPADEKGERTLPTPFSLHKEKRTPESIYDLSAEKAPDLERPVHVDPPFCTFKEKRIAFHTPARQITIHNRRDRVAGRATEKVGNVFRYEALAPGQTFIALILYPDNLAGQVKDLFSQGDILFFGLSRSAGYGKTRVTKVEALPDDWQEGGEAARKIKAGETFSLLLLSDAVLRDAHGHLTGFLTEEILERALDLPKGTITSKESERARTFSRSEIIGGFNRKWGMPLPQMWVARAGSVYTFTAQADIPRNKLQTLLEQGIGERRAEGFGRLALLPPDRPAQLSEVKEEKDERKHERRDAQDEQWLRNSRLMQEAQKQGKGTIVYTMVKRMLRHRLEKALIRQIHDVGKHKPPKKAISTAQLGAIRTLIRQARVSGEIEPIRRRLATMKKQARDQFKRVKIKGQNLEQWLNARLDEAENPSQAWQRFGKDESPAVWDEEMAREFILRLMDGVLDLLQDSEEKGGAS